MTNPRDTALRRPARALTLVWNGAYRDRRNRNLVSARRYMRLIGELTRGRFVNRALSKQGLIVALSLAPFGIAISIYMILVLRRSPTALHA